MRDHFFLCYDKTRQVLYYSESQGIRNKKAEEILRDGSQSISATFTHMDLNNALLSFIEFYLDLELIDSIKFEDLDK